MAMAQVQVRHPAAARHSLPTVCVCARAGMAGSGMQLPVTSPRMHRASGAFTTGQCVSPRTSMRPLAQPSAVVVARKPPPLKAMPKLGFCCKALTPKSPVVSSGYTKFFRSEPVQTCTVAFSEGSYTSATAEAARHRRRQAILAALRALMSARNLTIA